MSQENLALDDRPKSSGTQPPSESMGRNRIPTEPRPDSFQNNLMPRPPSEYRISRSQQDEARRTSGLPRPEQNQTELNVFADPFEPPKHRDRRPRRNSESSIMDGRSAKFDSEEDRRRRRERRLRESKMPEGSRREGHRHGPSRPRKSNQRLDLIDKLDVTSIYGTGREYHCACPYLYLTNLLNQSFTTMDLLMLVTRTAIAIPAVHQCRRSRKDPRITPSVARPL